MFQENIKKKLKANWGEKAETLNCFAEIRLYDPLSTWCCYIYAMSPGEDIVSCVLYSNAMGLQISDLHMNFINSMYNQDGEHPKIDEEFRKTKVTELIRRYK